jgi:hypothetical protein
MDVSGLEDGGPGPLDWLEQYRAQPQSAADRQQWAFPDLAECSRGRISQQDLVVL